MAHGMGFRTPCFLFLLSFVKHCPLPLDLCESVHFGCVQMCMHACVCTRGGQQLMLVSFLTVLHFFFLRWVYH